MNEKETRAVEYLHSGNPSRIEHARLMIEAGHWPDPRAFLPQDSPKLPGVMSLMKNYVRAQASYVAHGFARTTEEDKQTRLNVCKFCEKLVSGDGPVKEWRCADIKCGCFLDAKSERHDQRCPLDRWPEPGEPA